MAKVLLTEFTRYLTVVEMCVLGDVSRNFRRGIYKIFYDRQFWLVEIPRREKLLSSIILPYSNKAVNWTNAELLAHYAVNESLRSMLHSYEGGPKLISYYGRLYPYGIAELTPRVMGDRLLAGSSFITLQFLNRYLKAIISYANDEVAQKTMKLIPSKQIALKAVKYAREYCRTELLRHFTKTLRKKFDLPYQ